MSSSRLSAALVGIIFLLATCSAPTGSGPQAVGADLSGTSWQLVKFQGSEGKTLSPDDKANYTLQFNPDGVLVARIDYNRGRGTWKSAGANQLRQEGRSRGERRRRQRQRLGQGEPRNRIPLQHGLFAHSISAKVCVMLADKASKYSPRTKTAR